MTTNKGDVIERIVRNKIGISELSRRLKVSRRAIYNWFENEQLNLETICKIGKAIDYDFTNEFPEEFANAQNQAMNQLTFKNVNQVEDDVVDYWMNKYIKLLEKYNDLLVDISYPDSKINLKPHNREMSDHYMIR